MKKPIDDRPPWKRARPKRAATAAVRPMTQEEKSHAKARALQAGRPYPNLVDNLAIIRARRRLQE